MLARDIQSIMAGSDPTFTDCKHWLAPTDITFLRVTTCHECHDVVTRFGQLSIIIITILKTWNKTNWIENKPNLMKKLELARCEKSDHAMWRCPRQWLGLAPYLQDARLNLRERRLWALLLLELKRIIKLSLAIIVWSNSRKLLTFHA